MMIHSKPSSTYAHLLLMHAINHGRLEQIGHEVSRLHQLLQAHPSLKDVFQNPTVPSSCKQNLLEHLCKHEVSEMLWRFLVIMLNQRKIALLQEICSAFRVAYNEYIGVQTALLTTAVVPPTHLVEGFIEEVKQYVVCKDVHLTQQIDPSIIGGYILQIGSLKLNKSIKNYLKRLQESIH